MEMFTNSKAITRLLALLATCVLLSACGGGGGGGGGGEAASTSSSSSSRQITNTNTGEALTLADLSWETPSERENGDPISPSIDIQGYVIRYRYLSGNDDSYMYIDINDYSITQAIIEDLEAGDYEFSIASVGTDGLQGSYSNSQFITLSA